MNDFWKTRITKRDIAKYNVNIIKIIFKIWTSEVNSRVAEQRLDELPFNNN